MTSLEKKLWDCCCTTNKLLAKIIGSFRGMDRIPAQPTFSTVSTNAIGQEIVKADPERTMLLISSGTSGAAFYPFGSPTTLSGWLPGVAMPFILNARDHCDLVGMSFVAANAVASTWNVIELGKGCFPTTPPPQLAVPANPSVQPTPTQPCVFVDASCPCVPRTLHAVTSDIGAPSCLGGLMFDLQYVGLVGGFHTWRAINSQCGGKTVTWEIFFDNVLGWTTNYSCNAFSGPNQGFTAVDCVTPFFDSFWFDLVGNDCGVFQIRIVITG